MPFKKNVFLLGAGASADAGAPLMWNFLKVASGLMRDPRCGRSRSLMEMRTAWLLSIAA
jgi:hypothetical protein